VSVHPLCVGTTLQTQAMTKGKPVGEWTNRPKHHGAGAAWRVQITLRLPCPSQAPNLCVVDLSSSTHDTCVDARDPTLEHNASHTPLTNAECPETVVSIHMHLELNHLHATPCSVLCCQRASELIHTRADGRSQPDCLGTGSQPATHGARTDTSRTETNGTTMR